MVPRFFLISRSIVVCFGDSFSILFTNILLDLHDFFWVVAWSLASSKELFEMRVYIC